MTNVRRASTCDAQTLARLGAETFVDTFGHLYRPSDLSAFLAEYHVPAVYEAILADQRSAAWIAESVAGQDLGYCVAGPCTLPVPGSPPGSGELARLYLRREAQGSGLGAQMLDIALAWLRERYDRIFLSVFAENIRAQRLYASRGFVKVCDYFYMVGEHADPEWIMELRPGSDGFAPQQSASR